MGGHEKNDLMETVTRFSEGYLRQFSCEIIVFFLSVVISRGLHLHPMWKKFFFWPLYLSSDFPFRLMLDSLSCLETFLNGKK